MTRFGEISSLWQNSKRLLLNIEGLFRFWAKFEPTLEIYCAIGQTIMFENGQH